MCRPGHKIINYNIINVISYQSKMINKMKQTKQSQKLFFIDHRCSLYVTLAQRVEDSSQVTTSR